MKKIKNIYIFLVLLFLYLPILVLVFFSFNTSKLNIIFSGFTFKWYKELFMNIDLLEAFRNTLIVSITSTIISTVIGTISAIGLKKFDFKGKKIINEILYIPIVIPEIVLGIALLSIFTLTKIVLSHISFSIPFVIISVKGVLESINPNLELSCADLGANSWQTFFYITLPMLMPGIKSGAMLAFTLSLDDVIISYFTAGPHSNTLPLKIYSMIKGGISPDVNALTTLMLLVTCFILFISTYIQIKNMKTGSDTYE